MPIDQARRPKFFLQVVASDNTPDAGRRLARVTKLLKHHGFTCVAVGQIDGNDQVEAANQESSLEESLFRSP